MGPYILTQFQTDSIMLTPSKILAFWAMLIAALLTRISQVKYFELWLEIDKVFL
jgi:hypothetical protein